MFSYFYDRYTERLGHRYDKMYMFFYFLQQFQRSYRVVWLIIEVSTTTLIGYGLGPEITGIIPQLVLDAPTVIGIFGCLPPGLSNVCFLVDMTPGTLCVLVPYVPNGLTVENIPLLEDDDYRGLLSSLRERMTDEEEIRNRELDDYLLEDDMN